MRVLVFLLLLTTAAQAQETSGTPSLDWLAPAMASTPQCGAPAANDPSLNPPPHQFEILARIVYGAIEDFVIVSSSGNSAFDRRAERCLWSIPIKSAPSYGPIAFFAWLNSNNGAVVLSPDRPPHWGVADIASEGPPHICPYPRPEALLREMGRVAVDFKITADGSVTDVSIEQSSGHLTFDNAAVACVSQWRYRPVIQNGVPVEVLSRALIDWSLGPDPLIATIATKGVSCSKDGLKLEDLTNVVGPTVLELKVRGRSTDAIVKGSSGSSELDQRASDCFETVAAHQLGGHWLDRAFLFQVIWK